MLLPPLFQTDTDHLNLLVQESPMLSPNPPPSVVESNGQNMSNPIGTLTSNVTLLSDQMSSAPHQNCNNTLSNNSNSKNTATKIPTTNVIINNIKANTTTIGTTNLESGIVQQTSIIAPEENNKSIFYFIC